VKPSLLFYMRGEATHFPLPDRGFLFSELDMTKLIVGLGNPGVRYAKTRHNAGFMVLDELARRNALTFRPSKLADETKLEQIMLIKPTTFMNLSGQAVQAYQTKLGLKPEEILLVHDDLDMPLGRLRFKQNGGAGGQRGVQDTLQRIGANFLRLKIGISRPPERWTVENWVLSKFSDDEKALLDKVISAGADAVECLLKDGLERSMNAVNGLNLSSEIVGNKEGDNKTGAKE
jgi:peptidyl-tRNA hydrolase, PTH1 family